MKSYKTLSELPGSQYFRDVVIGRTEEPRQSQGIGSRPNAQATPEEEQSMFDQYAVPILRRLGMMSDDPEITAQTVVPQLQPNRFTRSTSMEAWSRLPPPPMTGSIEGVLNSVRQTREALRDTGERGSNMDEIRRRMNEEPDPVNVEGSTRGAVPVSQQEGNAPEPTSYTIQSGDTLGRIASRNNTTVDAILAANPSISDPNKISVDQEIVIPAATETPTEIASETTLPEFSLTGTQTDYRETAVALANDLMRDLDLTQEQAAAIVGNLAWESGNFQTLQEIRPLVEGSRGGYGYAQWTAARRNDFENWASQNNLPVDSYEANYSWLLHELTNTTEQLGNIGKNVVERLRNGTNLNSMVRDFSGVSGQRSGFLMPSPDHANFAGRQSRAREVLGFLREGQD